MIRFLLLLAFAAVAAPTGAANAQERILSYDIEVEVNADGSLDVAEHITVRAEGQQIRRGIYRDFPTRYRDRLGNRVVVDLEVREVLRNGQPEPWFTENKSNGVRINTGDDDFLPVPGDHVLTLRYRTTRQIGFFDAHDELYWNAIGTGWAFPIEDASVVVRLPEPVPVDQLSAEAYTGPQGARGESYTTSLPAPGTAQWQLTEPLPPGHGMTIVLMFPKGIVAAPTSSERTGWFLRDNLGVLVALLALGVLLAYTISRWRAVGRDPVKGVVIARYEPPEGHTPGGLRYVRRMGADHRGFSADLLALAVAGHLRIHRDKGLLGDDWSVEQLDGPTDDLDDGRREILSTLFEEGPLLELDSKQAAILQAARQAHASRFKSRYQPAMFRTNAGSTALAALIAVGGSVAAFLASGGAGLLIVIGIAVLMLVVVVAFGLLVKAPTPQGRRLMDEIEGLALYLGVAEREELARIAGPGNPAPRLDASRYEQLLPFAVALEVEDAWTEQFTLAAGAEAAAAATRNIGWYHGGDISSLSRLASDVGGALDSRIASASTPPGSSSGGGGGGFSGGGGGGGGGGGR